jgi:hypothetical protein
MSQPATSLEAEFAARAPWVTRFIIEGKAYGGELDLRHDPALALFAAAFPRAKMVLELGPLEGGRTFALAGLPHVKRILAVEGRRANIAKARFVQSLLGVERIQWIEANLETAVLEKLGRFDVIFSSGVLYHLPEPWQLIEQCARASPSLFLSTHFTASPIETRHGLAGTPVAEGGVDEPLSGLSPTSFWLSQESLMQVLAASNYTSIEVLLTDTLNPNGPWIILAASQDSNLKHWLKYHRRRVTALLAR